MASWVVDGFSHLGKSHESDGLDNQDSFGHMIIGETCILIVSDGAGSAKQAKQGSSTLIETVQSTFSKLPNTLFEQPIAKLPLLSAAVETAVSRARDTLSKPKGVFGKLLGKQPDEPLDSFSATLILVISTGAESVIFHIGDGYGGVALVDSETGIQQQFLSFPQNGEFDNETYFFTDNDWLRHFRTTVVDSPVNYLFAMSDGADPFMINQQRDSLDERVNGQLFQILGQDGPPPLAKVFTKDKVHSVSHDDSTLLVSRQ